jgi:hypothetical protein
VPVHQIQ